MARLTGEERNERSLKRLRTRALTAEADYERSQARHRGWEANGTRMFRAELETGVSCRGCGRVIVDGRCDWPALINLTADEQDEHEAEETAFRTLHADCRAGRWTVSGSRTNHCMSCCPPPPLSQQQIDKLTTLLTSRVEPRALATWRLRLTCESRIERTQHRDHDRWSGSVAECPTCGRHRGVVTADRLSER